MTVRDLIPLPCRVGFSFARGCAALVGAFAVCLVSGITNPAPARGYVIGYGEEAIGIQVVTAESDELVLFIAGSGLPRPDTYVINARAPRIPCPGRYSMVIGMSDPEAGTEATITTTLLLSRYRSYPPGLSCETAIPSGPGSVNAIFDGTGQTSWRMHGTRHEESEFEGRLHRGPAPDCGPGHSLAIRVALRGWVYRFLYSVRVINTKTTEPGKEPERPCR